jgi:hypothetical protein
MKMLRGDDEGNYDKMKYIFLWGEVFQDGATTEGSTQNTETEIVVRGGCGFKSLLREQ